MADADEQLQRVLERSRDLGFLGPGGIDAQVAHALTFLPALCNRKRILDLGSGGGLPGLVLATHLTDADFVLLDSQGRRCTFLESAVEQLELGPRVSVVNGRAEDVAQTTSYRKSFDAVVSRSFGPPAVTAECAVGFLRGPGAILAVSEPPVPDPDRWPREGLQTLGLEPAKFLSGASGGIQILRATASCPDRFPRRTGVPSKRPLF